MLQHPVFARRVENGPEGKVIVVTILEAYALDMTDKDNDVFFIASTDKNFYTNNNPTITLDKSSKTSSEKYVQIVNEANGRDFVEPTKGNGITEMIRGAYWFIKKSKSILEMMG